MVIYHIGYPGLLTSTVVLQWFFYIRTLQLGGG